MSIIENHLDKNSFLSAIEFTAAETNFEPGLIEKDYFCSVLLSWISSQDIDNLNFKGGTLLAKGHAGFYRLSDDLDFTLPTPSLASRKIRSEAMSPLKSIFNQIPKIFKGIDIKIELKGSNESRQYNAEISYESILGFKEGRILIEIGLREELLESPIIIKLNTLLINPFTKKQFVSPFDFRCLSRDEAYAEKIRAALTSNRLAIRDFFDLDFALKRNLINLNDEGFIKLVSKKIENNNNILLELNNPIKEQLKRKIITELVPTLRKQEIGSFDLNKVIENLELLQSRLKLMCKK
ncbi:MAG: nucleotidyl transferase AbiEii/AbiGii toxin family protein [Gammaproteobacteria bacterium]|nr:nucleotidyl transferase AbiEii/AbiGii toxin family protein [Gammaproteobacteria bacterium]